jgi:hypothetical protein
MPLETLPAISDRSNGTQTASGRSSHTQRLCVVGNELDRDAKDKAGAQSQFAFHRELAAHSSAITMRQRQAEPHVIAVITGGFLVGIAERLEQSFDLALCNPNSSVLDHDRQHASFH